MLLNKHRGGEGYMEYNTHREAGGAAHPQNPCSLGVLGLLSRAQHILCHEASSVGILVLLVHLHPQGWVEWNQPGPCTFPRISGRLGSLYCPHSCYHCGVAQKMGTKQLSWPGEVESATKL